MKNIAELNLLKSNLIIHKLAACVLLTGFLLRLLLKQRKTHVATFLFHCCNCRDALMLFAAQRFLSPVVERPAATANPGTPVVETCMEFTGSTELLHCCQLCFKFYCLPQNVKKKSNISIEVMVFQKVFWCIFALRWWRKQQVHPISILQASRTSFKESWVSKLCPKVEHNDGTLMINRLACSSISINTAIYLQAKWLQSVGDVKMHNIELLEGSFGYTLPFTKYF